MTIPRARDEHNKELFKLDLNKGIKLVINTTERGVCNTTNPLESHNSGSKLFSVENKTLLHFSRYSSGPVLAYSRFDIERKEWYGKCTTNGFYYKYNMPISEKRTLKSTSMFNILQDEYNLNKFHFTCI
ncbi:hypothetical protein K502DRAFT_350758 [Neoconidiobolus thromboides FSU 785]|nr:hypothetical protein K502DRAFT_350758 [Neoconidiobolus thromboides FSU 785]